MAKFKIKYVKFVFFPKNRNGNDWNKTPEPDIRFGNRCTDTVNEYKWNKLHISHVFSEFLNDDNRRWRKDSKFTTSEATIMLLKYIEKKLKKCHSEHKRLMKLDENSAGIYYAKNVNVRDREFYKQAAKLWRKKVKDLKKSPEYLWEQLSK